VLGLPFVSVAGESALRLDVPAGRLHAFGASFAIDEAFVVLASLLFATAAFLLVTLLLGRVWCGWACPQTVLGDLTALALRLRERRGASRRTRALDEIGRAGRDALAFALVALVAALVAANVLWYFVAPGEFFARLAAGTLGPVLSGAWVTLAAIVFLDLALLRARFCATACPYAMLQGILFDRSTLVVAYDRRREADCVDCGACVRVCPTAIDIRHGLQVECIACAACIDACAPIMGRLRRAPDLVGYFFGEPGAPARPLRAGVVALAAATAASAALVVAVVAARALLDLSAVPEDAVRPRLAADGRAVNAYSVALENHRRAPVHVVLALAAPGAEIAIRPDAVELGPGERRQIRVVASARGLPPGRAQGQLTAAARAGGAVVERRTQRVAIVVPEAP
jgi:cytochrome c oxidase accessory protein FixG